MAYTTTWRNGAAAIEEDFIILVGEGLSTAEDGFGEGLTTIEDGDGEGLYTVEDGCTGLTIARPDSGLATINKEWRRTRAETPGGGGVSDCRLRF